MRIGVYGGSFNPPHIGHAMVMAWLGWSEIVDQVWMLPTYSHAFGKQLAPFALRCELCEAMAGLLGDWVHVQRIESELPSPSYTIDTLDTLAARHPAHRFQLVVGSDVLPDTPKWKDWARIEAEYAPIIVGRSGYDDIPGRPSFPRVSSTEIRERLATGASVQHLIPAAVARLLPPDLYRGLINSPTRS